MLNIIVIREIQVKSTKNTIRNTLKIHFLENIVKYLGKNLDQNMLFSML